MKRNSKLPANTLTLLSRLIAQPWAIRQEEMALFTQLLLAGEVKTREVANWDGTTTTQRAQSGYTPLNGESWIKAEAGNLPPVPEGVHVFLVWGVVGRAWTYEDRWWFDPVDVDDLTAAVSAVPEGDTVVLWFRSPGGIIHGIPESAEALRKLGAKRRILSFSDDLCASAAYWLASQAETIHSTPTADIGGIGVYIGFYDWCDYLEKAGVKLELFKAGRLKAMGLPGNPLSEEERAHLQASVNEGYKAFTADVLRNREIDAETMQGQTLHGKAAYESVLVDGFYPSAAAYFEALGKGKI